MIRPLRQRHRRIFFVLAIFLPLAFAAGLAARKPLPAAHTLASVLTPAPEPAEEMVWQRSDLFSNPPVVVRLFRERRAGRLAVQFSAAADFLKPDLLVYWIAEGPTLTGSLPEHAVLLGKFEASALSLTPFSVTNRGTFLLYSLADNQIVAGSKPLRVGDSTQKAPDLP